MKHYSIILEALLASCFLFACTQKEEEIPVSSVAISQPAAEMIVGETVKLSALISPSNATDKDVIWASSKQSVATIDKSGLVTAIAEGTSNITATAGGKTGTCLVTVNKRVVEVSSIELNKKELSLVEEEEFTLVATVKPDNATEKTVTWTSSDSSVATVENGRVAAIKQGTASITARAGNKSASCVVSVSKKVVAVTEVLLDKTSLSLVEGDEATLTATVRPDNATDKTITWSSSAPTVAKVENGKVVAVMGGSATITAKAGDKSATCSVTVQQKVIAVTSISLNITSLSLTKGQSETLVATIEPDNATDKTVTWTTTNSSVVTVKNGQVTAKGGGFATILAKAGDKEASCSVTVSVPVSSITLDKEEISIVEGETTQLTVTIYPSDATDSNISWTSTNTSIATVSQDGLVVAIKEGESMIAATVGGKTAQCKVFVSKKPTPVEEITLNTTKLELKKGQSVTLVATVSPPDATDKTVTWTTTNSSVATVDQSGKVTAIKSGTAVIMAKAGNETAGCEVSVSTPVESISLDNTSINLEEGHTMTLVATVFPTDADEKAVIWESKETSIATVNSNGLVTAIKEGQTIITASAGGHSATCTVVVCKETIPVTSVRINKSIITLLVGDTYLLEATVMPDNATDKTVTWTSEHPEIATVDQEGKVSGINGGSVLITAKAGDKEAKCTVIVRVPITGLDLNKHTMYLSSGQSETLSVIFSPSEAENSWVVDWVSSNPSVASVEYGKVTALKSGTAEIKAYIAGTEFESTCMVYVDSYVESISLNHSTIQLRKGESTQMTAEVLPSGVSAEIVWGSENASVASIDSNGLLSGVSSGQTRIFATAEGKTAYCSVSVIEVPLTSMSFEKDKYVLIVGSTYTPKVKLNPENTTDSITKWTSSNEQVATVNKGVIHALSVGESIIEAIASNGKKASCKITVKETAEGEHEGIDIEIWD